MSPEQSKPPVGDAPPQTYGVPMKCCAIATAAVPLVEPGLSCSQAERSNGTAGTKAAVAVMTTCGTGAVDATRCGVRRLCFRLGETLVRAAVLLAAGAT